MEQKEATKTIKLYETDGHTAAFAATVTACTPNEKGEYEIELDRTAFFPRGGGQECDTGTLDKVPVTQVVSVADRICHITQEPLPVGQTVQGKIDYETRFCRMQNHSGEHILSGLVDSIHHLNNVGFHLGDGYVTLDFDGILEEDDLLALEEKVNRIIWENRPITAYYPTPDELATLSYRSKLDITENVRIVSVEGVDCCACCVPHCRTTGEIGLLKITDHIHYKGGVRLWIQCGAWALADYRMKQENVLTVSRTFSVKPHQAGEAVARALEETNALRSTLGEVRCRLAEALLDRVQPDAQSNLLFFENSDVVDSKTQRNLATQGATRCEGVCGVFCLAGEEWRFVCVSGKHPPFSLKALVTRFREAGFSANGGGNDMAVQGTVTASKDALLAFFHQI